MTPHVETDIEHLKPRIPGRQGQQELSLNTLSSVLNLEGISPLFLPLPSTEESIRVNWSRCCL